MLHFKALPRQAFDDPSGAVPALTFEPKPERAAMLDRALASIEFRGAPLEAQLAPEGPEPARLVARPPEDLPALLRTAWQLEQRARQDAGERTLLWRCDCGHRFLVTLTPGQQASAACSHCARQYDFPPSMSPAAESRGEAARTLAEVNALRFELAGFLREAMARGWTVVAERESAQGPSASRAAPRPGAS